LIHGRLTRLRRIETADVERDISGPFAESESVLYLLIETHDGEPVGRLSVKWIDARHRGAEVMLYIGEKAANGKGYGADALGAACRYLLDQRALHRIGLTVTADNLRAIAVFERLGFHREGILRRHLWMDGAPVDEIVMSLLAGELREIR